MVLDDDALIEKAAGGDAAAFERLIERKRDRIFWTAYRIVGDRDDAEDIAQQVCLRLWKVLVRFRPGESFDTWLYRITVNASIDHHRRSRPGREAARLDDPGRRERGLGVSDAERTPPRQEEAVAFGQIQAIFDELAAGLGERQRAVFVLREIEGFATDEIARILQVRHSTVRNHLLQARRTLQRRMSERYPELVPSPRPGAKPGPRGGDRS